MPEQPKGRSGEGVGDISNEIRLLLSGRPETEWSWKCLVPANLEPGG